MNVLSLFDGMSCGRLALARADVPVTNYYASEIDKHVIKISESNYPDIIRLGDVTKWREWGLDWSSIDLVLAGSPCQGFSLAGRQLAFDDPRSALFFDFVDVLNAVEDAKNADVFFLLENVHMSAPNLAVIDDALGVASARINSAFYSAGMRDRHYWFNWDYAPRQVDDGPRFDDILDGGYAKRDKAFALTATYYKKGGEATRRRAFDKSQRPIAWISEDATRWLTPEECEKLMTVPLGYTEGVSNTQRYKMLGNGWTVDVVADILRGLPNV